MSTNEKQEKAPEAVYLKVAAKFRPINEREEGAGGALAVQVLPEKNQVTLYKRTFTFDAVFDGTTTQSQLYDSTVEPLVNHYLKGYNVSILAYGQTGSGKTYTMGTAEATATPSDPDGCGVVPRVATAIFDFISGHEHKEGFKITVSMTELYEEKVYDLLRPAGRTLEALPVRTGTNSFFIQGLTYEPVTTLNEVMFHLLRGCRMRTTGATAMNAHSSRSHAIFTINMEKRATSEEDTTAFTNSFKLVDLAGSERAGKTEAKGQRFKEGISINQGLLALGNVISALADNAQFVNYRDSTLTKLLMDSLGGNSYTLMLACCSPSDVNGDETMSTLHYADRAKRIKTKPTVNVDPQSELIATLRARIAYLEEEAASCPTHGAGSRGSQDPAAKKAIGPGDVSVVMPGTAASVGVDTKILSDLTAAKLRYDEQTRRMKEMRRQMVEAAERTSELRASEARAVERLESVRMILADGDLDQLRALLKDFCAEDEERRALASKDGDVGSSSADAAAAAAAAIRGGAVSDGDDDDVDDRIDDYIQQQAKLQHQLDTIVRQLLEKEREVLDVVRNNEQMALLHKDELENVSRRIQELDAEKRRVEEELRRARVAKNISEERRRRLQEMERELATLRRKEQELRRLEKTSKERQDRVSKLEQEIQDGKKLKVQLLRQLRHESENHRALKDKMEREVGRLRANERRREMEEKRKQICWTQQVAVLQRKFEDAVRANRRLQAVSRQHAKNPRDNAATAAAAAQESSAVTAATAITKEQAKAIVSQELDLATRAYEAKLAADQLLEARSVVASRLRATRSRRTRFDGQIREAQASGAATRSEEAAAKLERDMEARRALDAEIAQMEEQQRQMTLEIDELRTAACAEELAQRESQRWETVAGSSRNAQLLLGELFALAESECRRNIEAAKAIEEAEDRVTAAERERLSAQEKANAEGVQYARQCEEVRARLDAERHRMMEQVTTMAVYLQQFVARHQSTLGGAGGNENANPDDITEGSSVASAMAMTLSGMLDRLERLCEMCSRRSAAAPLTRTLVERHADEAGGKTKSTRIRRSASVSMLDEDLRPADPKRQSREPERFGDLRNTLEALPTPSLLSSNMHARRVAARRAHQQQQQQQHSDMAEPSTSSSSSSPPLPPAGGSSSLSPLSTRSSHNSTFVLTASAKKSRLGGGGLGSGILPPLIEPAGGTPTAAAAAAASPSVSASLPNTPQSEARSHTTKVLGGGGVLPPLVEHGQGANRTWSTSKTELIELLSDSPSTTNGGDTHAHSTTATKK